MKFKYCVYSMLAGLLLIGNACQPDEYELGSVNLTPDDLIEGISYTITHDDNNPNIVHLKSLMPSNYTVVWEHPQGRSQDANVTLRIPFEGTYEVDFGVMTPGGVVYGKTSTFEIDGFCADFINDELWTNLSGGVGNSKTWKLDIDANGQCRYFVGPLYFYGTDDNWNTVTLGQAAEDGKDSWNWLADWAGNGSWIFDTTGAMDYGSMTFDLINGANVTVESLANGMTYQGKYMLNVDDHTMTLTDAPLLHDPGREAIVTKWGDITIMSLTENTMQLGVLRDNDPKEGPCLLVYNFISEEYYNNWTPTIDTNLAPTLPEDWREYVEPVTNKVITYLLSLDTPYDWCELDGTPKGIDSEAADGIDALSLVLNSGSSTYTVTAPDGTVVEGSYTLSDDGVYTFSNGLPEVVLSTDGRAVFQVGSGNTLRILSYETDDYSGALTSLWLGGLETDNMGSSVQYMGYNFEPVMGEREERFSASLNFFDTGWTFINSETVYITGEGSYTLSVNGASSAAYGMYLDVLKILNTYPNMDMTITDIKVDGTSIEFDDAIIDRVIGDVATTARRYILNPWGDTAGDAPKYTFTSSIEVTIEVVYDNGAPFIPEEEEAGE